MISAEDICEELYKRRGKAKHKPNLHDTYYAKFMSLINVNEKIALSNNTLPTERKVATKLSSSSSSSSQQEEKANNKTNFYKPGFVDLMSTKYTLKNNLFSSRESSRLSQECQTPLYKQWDKDINIKSTNTHTKNECKCKHNKNDDEEQIYKRSSSYDPQRYVEDDCNDDTNNDNYDITKVNKSLNRTRKSYSNNYNKRSENGYQKSTSVETVADVADELNRDTLASSLVSSTGLTVVCENDSDTNSMEEYNTYRSKLKNKIARSNTIVKKESNYKNKQRAKCDTISNNIRKAACIINSNNNQKNNINDNEFDILLTELNYKKLLAVFQTNSLQSFPTLEYTELESVPTSILSLTNRKHHDKRNKAANNKSNRSTVADIAVTTTATAEATIISKSINNNNNNKHSSNQSVYNACKAKKQLSTNNDTTTLSLHNHKTCKSHFDTFDDHDANHNNKKPRKDDMKSVKIFVTVDKLNKTMPHKLFSASTSEGKSREHYESSLSKTKQNFSNTQAMEDKKIGIYNTYDVLPPPPLPLSLSSLSVREQQEKHQERQYEENNELQRLQANNVYFHSHSDTIDKQNNDDNVAFSNNSIDIHNKAKAINSIKTLPTNNERKNTRNPFDIEVSLKADIPGPGTYDLTMLNDVATSSSNNNNNNNYDNSKSLYDTNKKSSVRTLQHVITKQVIASNLLEEYVDHSEEKVNSSNDCTVNKKCTLGIDANDNKVKVIHRREEISPGPGSYDLQNAYAKNIITQSHSAPAWTIRNVRTERPHENEPKLNMYYINYDDNNTMSRQYKKQLEEQEEQQQLHLPHYHHYHDSNSIKLNNKQNYTKHNSSPGPLTYDVHEYNTYLMKSTFGTAKRWKDEDTFNITNNNNNNSNNNINDSSSRQSSVNLPVTSLQNRKTLEELAIPGPGAYSPLFTQLQGNEHAPRFAPKVSKLEDLEKVLYKANVDINTIHNFDSNVRQVPGPGAYDPFPMSFERNTRQLTATNAKRDSNSYSSDKKWHSVNNVESTPGPTTYYPSFDLTTGQPPRTVFASSPTTTATATVTTISNIPITITATNKDRNNKMQQSNQNNRLQQEKMSSNDNINAPGPGMYDTYNDRFESVHGGTFSKSSLGNRYQYNDQSKQNATVVIDSNTYDTRKQRSTKHIIDDTSIKAIPSMSSNNTEPIKHAISIDIYEHDTIGPGSYDILYSEGNVKAHTPTAIMRTSLQEQTDQIKFSTDNSNNHNSSGKNLINGPGPETYSLPSAFHSSHLPFTHHHHHHYDEQQEREQYKDNKQQEIPLESILELPESIHVSKHNGTNKKRVSNTVQKEFKTSKEIDSTPGPGTYYIESYSPFNKPHEHKCRSDHNNSSNDHSNFESSKVVVPFKHFGRIGDTNINNNTMRGIPEITDYSDSIIVSHANLNVPLTSARINYYNDADPKQIIGSSNFHYTVDDVNNTYNCKSLEYIEEKVDEQEKQLQEYKPILSSSVSEMWDYKYNAARQLEQIHNEEYHASSEPTKMLCKDNQQKQEQHYQLLEERLFPHGAGMTFSELPSTVNWSLDDNFITLSKETLPKLETYALYKHNDHNTIQENDAETNKVQYKADAFNSEDTAPPPPLPLLHQLEMHPTLANRNGYVSKELNMWNNSNNSNSNNNIYCEQMTKVSVPVIEQIPFVSRIPQKTFESVNASTQISSNNNNNNNNKYSNKSSNNNVLLLSPSTQNKRDNASNILRQHQLLHQVFIRPLDDDSNSDDTTSSNRNTSEDATAAVSVITNSSSNNNNKEVDMASSQLHIMPIERSTLTNERSTKKKRVTFALDVQEDNKDANVTINEHKQIPFTYIQLSQSAATVTESNQTPVPLLVPKSNQIKLERVINMSPEPERTENTSKRKTFTNVEEREQLQQSNSHTNLLLQQQELEHEQQQQQQQQQHHFLEETGAAYPTWQGHALPVNTMSTLNNFDDIITSNNTWYNVLPNPNTLAYYMNTNTNVNFINQSDNCYTNISNDKYTKFQENNNKDNNKYSDVKFVPRYNERDDATTLAKLAQFGYPVV